MYFSCACRQNTWKQFLEKSLQEHRVFSIHKIKNLPEKYRLEIKLGSFFCVSVQGICSSSQAPQVPVEAHKAQLQISKGRAAWLMSAYPRQRSCSCGARGSLRVPQGFNCFMTAVLGYWKGSLAHYDSREGFWGRLDEFSSVCSLL